MRIVQSKRRDRRQLLRRRYVLIILLISVAHGSGNEHESPNSAKELRVLFIGNSLTYSNNLPAIVEALAIASGQRRLAYKVVAFANYSLEDHWNQGEARQAIARGGWDVVILQQGPSASSEGRQLLLEYTRRFAQEIRRAGAKAALYMVWPASHRKLDFDGVVESYRQAAQAVEGLLLPVGEAWRGAWKRNPELKLYSPDGLHPTEAGSYLAALIIYQRLYGQSPVGLPSRLKLRSGPEIVLPTEQVKLMQEAALETNRQFERRLAP